MMVIGHIVAENETDSFIAQLQNASTFFQGWHVIP